MKYFRRDTYLAKYIRLEKKNGKRNNMDNGKCEYIVNVCGVSEAYKDQLRSNR